MPSRYSGPAQTQPVWGCLHGGHVGQEDLSLGHDQTQPLWGCIHGGHVGTNKSAEYRGTSVIRKRTLLGPSRRPMRRVLGGSQGGGRFLMDEVSLNSHNPLHLHLFM
jgi:hypothetical protein